MPSLKGVSRCRGEEPQKATKGCHFKKGALGEKNTIKKWAICESKKVGKKSELGIKPPPK